MNDYDNDAKYAFLKIRRIQKYEYAFPKYDWTKGKYASKVQGRDLVS